MGLVLPMVVVVPPSEFGTIAVALQRIEGIVAALVASVVVGGLWASFGWGMPVAGATAPSPAAPPLP
jgi:hypothetical protein